MTHYLTLHICIFIDSVIDNNLIRKKKNVHTVAQYAVREIIFMVLAGLFSQGDNRYAMYSWVLSHIVYWWTFDTELNAMRKKPLHYLSDKGLDGIQPHTKIWWIAKLIFAIAASIYFFKPELFYL